MGYSVSSRGVLEWCVPVPFGEPVSFGTRAFAVIVPRLVSFVGVETVLQDFTPCLAVAVAGEIRRAFRVSFSPTHAVETE